ncbi:MAG: segregation/condensation protein A [Leptospiraceae bacterium]|nr:segregation/condensation protein A [Leptospiraceae bacterium]
MTTSDSIEEEQTRSTPADSQPTPVAGSEEESEKRDPVQEALARFAVTWTNALGEYEEGPLYVLWDLIESYKVDIFDVSLFRITEDFFQFLDAMRELQIELASSFAVMASRLLFYKSKSLLPDPGFEENEEQTGLPPELVQQLLEYRKFQFAADRLRQREEVATGILAREKLVLPESVQTDGEWLDVSLIDLLSAYARLLQRLEKEQSPEKFYEIELEEFSVEAKMESIRKRLQQEQSFRFEDLFDSMDTLQRGDLIATFLALLELTRLREIIVRQKANFDEIRVFKKAVLAS